MDEHELEMWHEIEQLLNKPANRAQELGFQVYTAADALLPQEPIDWIVEGLIAPGTITLLVGEPGSGKTWATLSMATCIASGRDWVGHKVAQGRTLFIDEESGALPIKRRIARLMGGYGIEDDIPLNYVSMAGFDLRRKAGVQKFRELIGRAQPDVIIIDALADVMAGGDENSVKDVQPVFSALRQIVNDYQVTIVIIHHSNRNGSYRGSSAMKGAVDVLLNIDSGPNDTILLSTEKIRDGEPAKFKAKIHFDGEYGPVALSHISTKDRRSVQDIVRDYVRENGPCSSDEIIRLVTSTDKTKSSAKWAINKLVEEGSIERLNDGGRGIKAIYGFVRESS